MGYSVGQQARKRLTNLFANSVWQDGPTAGLPAAWGAEGATGARTLATSTLDPLSKSIRFQATAQRPFVSFVGEPVVSGYVATISFVPEVITDVSTVTWAQLFTIAGVAFAVDFNGVTANGADLVSGLAAGSRIYIRVTFTASGTPAYRIGLGAGSNATGDITLSLPTAVRGRSTNYIRTGLTEQGPFDILPIFGQSNTFNGLTLDPQIDISTPRVYQIKQNGAIALATEPLDHPVFTANAIGHALAFARDHYAFTPGRNVLVVPYGINGSGFTNGHWNNGNATFEAAVRLANIAYSTYANNTWLALLWQAGETDATAGQTQVAHAAALDAAIAAFRSDLTAGSNIPVIVGGMDPTWVAGNATRQPVQDALADTPNRVANTAYASSTGLTTHDGIHYNDDSQRTLAQRKHAAYAAL